MTPRIRIAGDWPAAEPGLLGNWALEVDSPSAPPDPARLAAWQRLLRERRAARGWDELAAARALESPAMRAIAALLDRACDAALLTLPERDSRAALALLEPVGGGRAALARFASPPGNSEALAGSFAWLELPAVTTVGESALALATAAHWLGLHLGCPAFPVVVHFAAGKNNSPRRAQVVSEHLRSRAASLRIDLYSGLFYRHGELESARLLEAVRNAFPAEARESLPVCWSPQLDLSAFGHHLLLAGGAWSGAVLAGAEALAALLPAPACAAARRATLLWLARLAAPARAAAV